MATSTLRIKRYGIVAEFLSEAGPWLLVNEVDNWQPLNAAYSLAAEGHPFHPPYFLAAIEDRARIVGCAIRPPPDQLDVTAMPRGAPTMLVDEVAGVYADLPNVGGPPDQALEFARAWVRARGGHWQIRLSSTLLALRAVQAPSPVPGKLRLAEETDWPTLAEWVEPYTRETRAHVDVAGFLKRRLRTRGLYVWDHDGPKCMVSLLVRTPTTVNVAGVFTPAAHRGRGYASNTVAAVSQMALDSGRTSCMMFAEREPAAAIRIYQRIGYQRQSDRLLIDLAR